MLIIRLISDRANGDDILVAGEFPLDYAQGHKKRGKMGQIKQAPRRREKVRIGIVFDTFRNADIVNLVLLSIWYVS
jgi:hypothetical protein